MKNSALWIIIPQQSVTLDILLKILALRHDQKRCVNQLPYTFSLPPIYSMCNAIIWQLTKPFSQIMDDVSIALTSYSKFLIMHQCCSNLISITWLVVKKSKVKYPTIYNFIIFKLIPYAVQLTLLSYMLHWSKIEIHVLR